MKLFHNKPAGIIDQLAFVAVSGTQAGDLMQHLTKQGFYLKQQEM